VVDDDDDDVGVRLVVGWDVCGRGIDLKQPTDWAPREPNRLTDFFVYVLLSRNEGHGEGSRANETLDYEILFVEIAVARGVASNADA
jgi:hypothetical protein